MEKSIFKIDFSKKFNITLKTLKHRFLNHKTGLKITKEFDLTNKSYYR
jgi:hypothetical protein